MKSFLCLIFTAFLITLISCEKDETIYADNRYASSDKLIVNDLSTLNKRISFKDNPLVYSFNDPFVDEKGMPEASLNIQVIGSLASPSYKGEILQASHIRILDDYAYVAYNTQGERYLGGVDIVDINPANDPVLISNLIYIDPETNKGKDVSSVDIEPQGNGLNKYLWFAGAEEANIDLESPAILGRLALNSSNQFEEGNDPGEYYDLKGYVGTDVRYFNGRIYATSGTGGGLTVLDNEMNKVEFYNIENARSIDVNSNYTIALGGNPGHIYFPGLWDAIVGGAADPEAKSIIRLGKTCRSYLALVALGEDGLKCFNLDQSISDPVSSIPRPIIQDDTKEWDYVTNGVSVSNSGWVYIANGAGGLDIAKLDHTGKLNHLGNIDLGASVNFVEASDNYVFVATGPGGLKILKVTEN